jgi:hypothetical protein
MAAQPAASQDGLSQLREVRYVSENGGRLQPNAASGSVNSFFTA